MLQKKCNISTFSSIKAKYVKFGTMIFIMFHKSLCIKQKALRLKGHQAQRFVDLLHAALRFP